MAAGRSSAAGSATSPITEVLVEERLEVVRECYAGIVLDDRRRCPVAPGVGPGRHRHRRDRQGAPEAVAELPVDPVEGSGRPDARERWRRRRRGRSRDARTGPGDGATLWRVARSVEARAAEINPLVHDERRARRWRSTAASPWTTPRCSATRSSASRWPASWAIRPTELERIAWEVERDDYRGTFYFIQMRDRLRPRRAASWRSTAPAAAAR